MTTLIIARHGNTFEDGETPRRVGLRTDIPLTSKGREQAAAIGRWLKDNKMIPDVVYCSELRRTIETAEIAIKESGYKQPAYRISIFNEIDYGPDENKTDEDVAKRIGKKAIEDWDAQGIVPPGWQVNPAQVIENWEKFAKQIAIHDDGETVLAVTSNGIARFAPHITGDFEGFRARHSLKISTGALCVLDDADGHWSVRAWNLKP